MKYMVQYSLSSSVNIMVEADLEEEAEEKAAPISDKAWDIINSDTTSDAQLSPLGCTLVHDLLELNAAFDEHGV